MPGSSLWLIPPKSHPLHQILSDLINKTLPSTFPENAGPAFSPHMTLTSNISPSIYADDPQKWIDSIPWPAAEDVKVKFTTIAGQDVFVRNCYIQAEFDGVRSIAGIARARGVEGEDDIGDRTEKWFNEWKAAFGPHVSLIYNATAVGKDRIAEITKVVRDAGVQLEGSSTGKPDSWGSWEGGVVWLVPTDRPIPEWTPIATRTL